MGIETIPVGPLQSNCYVVYDEYSLAAMVVDPGDEPGKIIRVIRMKGLKVEYIVCTHGHFDHIGGVSAIKNETGARLLINKADLEIYLSAKDHAALWGVAIIQPPSPDAFLKDGDEFAVGGLKFKCISTPGHSPGGICLYGEGIVMTGDTIFEGSVGRTDLYGGNLEDLKKSFVKIIALPPKTRIYPGHGPSTTVADEREFNFFIHELDS
jgi:hydroxyacylglutathione hydrolase